MTTPPPSLLLPPLIYGDSTTVVAKLRRYVIVTENSTPARVISHGFRILTPQAHRNWPVNHWAAKKKRKKGEREKERKVSSIQAKGKTGDVRFLVLALALLGVAGRVSEGTLWYCIYSQSIAGDTDARAK